jgi:RNA polymerase sigma-70 factor (family 1)
LKNSYSQKLLDSIALDNTEAFEEIYNHYSKELFFYAFRILNKSDVCEDVVQNVFLDLWVKRKTLRIENLKAYLFRCVKNQVLNKIRDRRISDEELARINIIDLGMDSSGHIEFKDLENIVNEHVSALPRRCREIFILSRFEQMSNKEIAEKLGISVQGVKNQISKALIRIRQQLMDEEIIVSLIFMLHMCFF